MDDDSAFGDHRSIKTITFTKGSGKAFNYDSEEREYTPWYYSRDTLTEVVFDEDVPALGKNFIYGAGKLTQITLPR